MGAMAARGHAVLSTTETRSSLSSMGSEKVRRSCGGYIEGCVGGTGQRKKTPYQQQGGGGVRGIVSPLLPMAVS